MSNIMRSIIGSTANRDSIHFKIKLIEKKRKHRKANNSYYHFSILAISFMRFVTVAPGNL